MLEFKNVTLKYAEDTVLDGISMQFEKGTINVITGNSGSGKSSIIKLINGVIPHFTKADFSGEILLNQKNIYELDIAKRSESISTVFQNPKSQFFSIDSFDEIAFALENRDIPRDEIIETIEEYATLLNTKHLLGKNIFKLSGGQRQLVAITGVAVMDGEVYIFDEPSSSLDGSSIDEFKNVIEKLRDMGKIIIIAEHRLYFLKELMDKLYILDKGRVIGLKKDDIREETSKYELRTLEKIVKEDLKCDWHKKNIYEKCAPRGALEMRDYKFGYGRGKVLFDMDLSIDRGINFIVGDNGIGKTIFIRSLCGLNKKFKGKTFYNGERIKRPQDYISLVMQDVNYQIFTESVWEELSLATEDDLSKERVLRDLNLFEKKDSHPQSLSGGEKQRLLIANAILSDKPIVVLDEPTSGLCNKTMQAVVNLLEMLKERDKIVIVVTHDYEFIKNSNGKVIEFVH